MKNVIIKGKEVEKVIQKLLFKGLKKEFSKSYAFTEMFDMDVFRELIEDTAKEIIKTDAEIKQLIKNTIVKQLNGEAL